MYLFCSLSPSRLPRQLRLQRPKTREGPSATVGEHRAKRFSSLHSKLAGNKMRHAKSMMD